MALAIILALLGALSVVADDSTYGDNAICANDQLMRWYDETSGLWPQDDAFYWWQAANMMSAFNDLARQNEGVRNTYSYVWDTTFNNAPEYNPSAEAIVGPGGVLEKVYHTPDPEERMSLTERQDSGRFVNEFYDDEGWWALAWLGALDNTGDSKYLDEAIAIWYDMNAAWDRHPCGGVPWNKTEGSGPLAIQNEIYIQLGAAIANRVGEASKATYLGAAQEAWTWFQNSGMINSDNLINDGLDPNTCANDGKWTFSYNQGVILGGLVELYRATGDGSYLDEATSLANAVITPGSLMLNENGILADECDKTLTCLGDGIQFKGVFPRNLQLLQKERPSEQWKGFLETSARSIWNNDLELQDGNCNLGVYWGGPVNAADPSSQSSALDCLNAAAAVQ